jgi:hypothetical protein
MQREQSQGHGVEKTRGAEVRDVAVVRHTVQVDQVMRMTQVNVRVIEKVDAQEPQFEKHERCQRGDENPMGIGTLRRG